MATCPGIGPWSAHGFLLVTLDRPDVFLTGDITIAIIGAERFGIDSMPQIHHRSPATT